MSTKKKSASPASVLQRLNIRFSFQYYDTEKTDYCLSKAEKVQILEIVKRLKEFSQKNYFDLSRDRTVLHFHSVDWSQTKEKKGFPYTEVNLLEPFQIALLGVNGQKARMYGAYSTDTFYIVWIDLEHVITPSYLKHT